MIGSDSRDAQRYLISYAPSAPAAPILDEAVEALDRGERAKAHRLRSAQDARRFIWRRYLRRYLLAETLGVSPSDLVFATVCPRCGSVVHGKPYLPDAPYLHFSAAQSGDPTAVAIGAAAFGIDVQVPSADLSEAAEVFAPDELAALRTDMAGAEPRRAVLWARKEAYLKAIGLGLVVDPAGVDARALGFADGVFGQISAVGQSAWSTASWMLPGAVVAIACARPSPVDLVEISAVVDPQTGRLAIRTAEPGGHEGETEVVYASSGANGEVDLSRAAEGGRDG